MEEPRPSIRSFRSLTGVAGPHLEMLQEFPRLTQYEANVDHFIHYLGLSIPCSQGQDAAPARESPSSPGCHVSPGAQAP